MNQLRGRRWTWREKRPDLITHVLLVLGGAFLAVVVATQVPADVTAMRVLLWYTVYAVVLTAALALAVALTPSLPEPGSTQLEGHEAEGVQSWPWQWRYDLAIDAGLVVALGTVSALGVAAGNGWTVPALLLAALAAWLLVRVGTALLGRRRNEALWLSDTHVVHDCSAGRARVAREQVLDVREVGGWVFVEHEGEAERTLAPRPWRREGRLNPRILLVDAGHLGPAAEELVAWLRAELGLDRPAQAEASSARRPTRWWRSKR